MKRKLRILNILFWVAVWLGAVAYTDTWRDPIEMLLEGLIPLMLGIFNHIALRPHPEGHKN